MLAAGSEPPDRNVTTTQDARSSHPHCSSCPPLPALPGTAEHDRNAWAAALYERFTASALFSQTLDYNKPTVPVILHPSAARGQAPPMVTARHLGFLRVDLLTGEGGPGRFFPLFPADTTEAHVGVDTGSLDRFDCTGHWASSGCVRLLAVESSVNGSHIIAGSCTRLGISAEASSGSARLLLMPQADFAELWVWHRAAPGGWHVPYANLLALEEAYGGVCRELKAAGHPLTRCHYMLRGWKTKDGRPRLGASSSMRRTRGIVPRDIVATRMLRAMIRWPKFLELLAEEGVQSVPTDGVRYWLARLGHGFQRQLADAGVLCRDTSVHHIIARANRGIDHPLNYFLIDKGPNSAMGDKVEGFTDAEGRKLHMRDIVGEQAFEVAVAACDLYHGMLYAGRMRGDPVPQTLRDLHVAAFKVAGDVMEARRSRWEQHQSKHGAAAATQHAAEQEGLSRNGGAKRCKGTPDEQQQQLEEIHAPFTAATKASSTTAAVVLHDCPLLCIAHNMPQQTGLRKQPILGLRARLEAALQV